jgi:hypothetical protein
MPSSVRWIALRAFDTREVNVDWKSVIRESLTASGHTLDEDVVDELATHANDFYQARVFDGLDAADAKQQTNALITSWCGDAGVLKRRPRRAQAALAPVSASRPFTGLLHDTRYAVAILLRRRAFTALSILTMALGIGVMTTLFSVAYGVLWKPLPWPQPESLLRLSENREGATLPHPLQISNGTYLAWQDHPETIESLAGFWTGLSTLTGMGDADRVAIGHITASVFSLVRARPYLGSLFTQNDEATDAKVVLSYGMWRERFGANPGALGKTIRIDGAPFTISAVMPQDFAFPDRSGR